MVETAWTTLELGEFADVRGGYGFPKEHQGEESGEYPFYKVSDMTLQGNDTSMRGANNWASESLRRRLKARAFPAGTIIFPKIGAAVHTNKKRILTRASLVDNNVMGVTVRDTETCLPPYLLRWFQSINLSDLSNPGTLPSITASRVKQQKVSLPSLPEQRRIAVLLSAMQRAIEQQKEFIALTAELKKALMFKLFTEGTRGESRKETEIGPIPESWAVSQLGSAFSLPPDNGLYKPKSDYGSGVQILRINDFSNDGDIVTRASNDVDVDEGEQAQYALAENDIVVNRVNSLSHLGKTALVGNLRQPMVFESNMMRFRVDESLVLASFVFRLMNSPFVKRQIIGRAKRAVAQSSVNQGDVAGLLIPLPSLTEQREIVEILEGVDKKAASHREEGALLEALSRTLLHQLMTAQLRVDQVDMSGLKVLGIEVD
jgi:type I restriction enzyme, S subunit